MAASTQFRRGDSEHDLLRKILNSLGGGIAIGSGDLLVRGYTSIVSASFTRAGNITQYHIDDVVGTSPASVMEFANVGRILGGSGYVTNVRLAKSTNATGSAEFRLWLFSATPTPIADHAPFTRLWADRAKCLGYVDFTLSSEGTGSDSAGGQATNVNLKFQCAADSKSIFGVLQANAAYTPGNAESFFVELTVDQN